MKITIIDNNLNFLNSMSNNLKKMYAVDVFASPIEIPMDYQTDMYLLSLGFTEELCRQFIEKCKAKPIILLVEAFDHTYLRDLILEGAKEYIVKPFSMDEIERKIRYFIDQEMAICYRSYVDHKLKDITLEKSRIDRLNPPMVIQSNNEAVVEKLVLQYCAIYRHSFLFISLNTPLWKEKITKAKGFDLLYISNLSELSKNKQNEIFSLLKGQSFIAYASEAIETNHKVLKINSEVPQYDGSYILDTDEYMKFILKKFQFKMTDTKLAKNLGISRKTLYDRRNRYSIYKNKRTVAAS